MNTHNQMSDYQKNRTANVTASPVPAMPTPVDSMPIYQYPLPQQPPQPQQQSQMQMQTQFHPQHAQPVQRLSEHYTPQHGPPGLWQHGMCDCFDDLSTCLLGFCLPCVLYSRTLERIRTSPSTLKNWSCINLSCLFWFCTCGSASTRQRNEIRYRYNLQGSGVGDCCRHLCCSSCTLIQEDIEVRDRERERSQMGAYAAPQQMSYVPQTQGQMNYAPQR
ncbi:PLAC8 family-domain-containing protein [Morchella snyderi]|nr:PLAC8 family-domain-containing protein [Morchella snyderi]